MALFQKFPRFNRKADEPVGLTKTKLKDGRCCWTEQRVERTHSRLRQARQEAARTGREPKRRGACGGLAERNEHRQPPAQASAATFIGKLVGMPHPFSSLCLDARRGLLITVLWRFAFTNV